MIFFVLFYNGIVKTHMHFPHKKAKRWLKNTLMAVVTAALH